MACKKEFRNISSISDRAQCRKKKQPKSVLQAVNFTVSLNGFLWRKTDERE